MLTAFIDTLPTDQMLAVWDNFFLKGKRVRLLRLSATWAVLSNIQSHMNTGRQTKARRHTYTFTHSYTLWEMLAGAIQSVADVA